MKSTRPEGKVDFKALSLQHGISCVCCKLLIYTIEILITMKVAALLLALASSASAFAPVSHGSASTALCALDDMAGSTMPFKTFDPLGLADLGSDSTLAWFRAAELKHSRVAMLAVSGYLVQAAGVHFPGMLSSDVSFESLSTMKPFDAWEAVPAEGQFCFSFRIILRMMSN